jgi:hypothetical protein
MGTFLIIVILLGISAVISPELFVILLIIIGIIGAAYLVFLLFKGWSKLVDKIEEETKDKHLPKWVWYFGSFLIGSLFLFSIFVDDPNAIETVNVKPVVKVENKTIVEESEMVLGDKGHNLFLCGEDLMVTLKDDSHAIIEMIDNLDYKEVITGKDRIYAEFKEGKLLEFDTRKEILTYYSSEIKCQAIE